MISSFRLFLCLLIRLLIFRFRLFVCLFNCLLVCLFICVFVCACMQGCMFTLVSLQLDARFCAPQHVRFILCLLLRHSRITMEVSECECFCRCFLLLFWSLAAVEGVCEISLSFVVSMTTMDDT